MHKPGRRERQRNKCCTSHLNSGGRTAQLRDITDGTISDGLVDLVGRHIGKVGVEAARLKAFIE